MKKKKTVRRARVRQKSRFPMYGLAIIVILVVVLIVVYAINRNKVSATFNCDGDRSVKAVFNTGAGGSVDLKLSDGRKMNLGVTASAGGARYANKSESVVFWNTGNTARLEEGGKETFKNCIQK